MTHRGKDRDRNEIGVIRKRWRGRVRVALTYPHGYAVGMSNLGFQTVYRQINQLDHVVCERIFLPSQTGAPVRSEESGRPLTDFDVIAFSISFESDYPNVLDILARSGIPLLSANRDPSHPFVLAGGIASSLNPEPLADIMDGFLIGEAEPVLQGFFDVYEPSGDRWGMRITLARRIPGCYIPALYEAAYDERGLIRSFRPTADVPSVICRNHAADLFKAAASTQVLTDDTIFEKTWLVEVGRGCPHGCRFCSAGFIYRPPRFHSLPQLIETVDRGGRLTDRIGLVGAAVSDLPGIDALCANFRDRNLRISFSSLRADALSPELIHTLKHAGVKTATIAPDAGSERLRRVINKGLTEEDILSAAARLVENGIPNLKLYFMVGLPTETEEDVRDIVGLVGKIKHHFLASSRPKGRIGGITVSLNSFVPKPVTPFQWAAMNHVRTLREKIALVSNGLKKIANVRLDHDAPHHAHLQSLFCRGDRRVGGLLVTAHHHAGNWAKTFKASPISPDFFALRERTFDEILPWDFIDHGVARIFLEREYRRALSGTPSPPCPMNPECGKCGACRGKDRGSENYHQEYPEQQPDGDGQ